jgi:methionyl aminopeptidase
LASTLIKNRTDRRHLVQAATIAQDTCNALLAMLEPGLPLNELETKANRLLAQKQSSAPFKRFDDFGFAICVSINDGVVNGPPTNELRISAGDVVSIAVGSEYRGLHGKAAQTTWVPDGSTMPDDVARLLTGSNAIFEQFPANHFCTLNEVITALTTVVETEHQLTLLAKTGGCGIGKQLHQFPPVPNIIEELESEVQLEDGMAFTLMPMTSLGASRDWFLADDGWTYLTQDGALAAHVGKMLIFSDGQLSLVE